MPDSDLSQFLPAVDQQLASTETPFVKATFERLLAVPDIDAEEARQMIALCLADEVEAMTAADRPFNTTRYRTLLDLLPTLPEG